MIQKNKKNENESFRIKMDFSNKLQEADVSFKSCRGRFWVLCVKDCSYITSICVILDLVDGNFVFFVTE